MPPPLSKRRDESAIDCRLQLAGGVKIEVKK